MIDRQNLAGKPLTPNEKDTLVLLGKGLTNEEIGVALERSRACIAERLKVIFAKIDVDRRVEAAVWACRSGML